MTVFTRKLEYKAENFAAVKELEKVMRDQSEQGVNQLKMLVEKILSEEAKSLTWSTCTQLPKTHLC